MLNFDFTKTLLNGSKQYIDNKATDGSTHTHSWNKLKNRPFYETEPIERIFCDIDSISGDNNQVPIEMLLIEDKTYIVMYNGRKYECIARKDAYGAIIIGNEYVGNSYYEDRDTGEPFYVSTYYIYDWANVAVKDNNSSLKIIYYETSIVELDKKYIPYIVGEKVEGKTMTDYNDNEYIGSVGAEIFNNYKKNIASGEYSHAEGNYTIASGECSHAEGRETIAAGEYSHAEGYDTIASAVSHAEGVGTSAGGSYSHAEGWSSEAIGSASHAEGRFTKASGDYQHVQGKYNIEDTENKYAHIVGNGTLGKPSNAHTLDWDGNAWFQGDIYLGGIGQSDANKMADYVVEEGTDDQRQWRYRKWNSGRAEAWALKYYSTAISSAWSSVYYAKLWDSFDYPSGLFKSPPSVYASSNNSESWITFTSGGNVASMGAAYLVCPITKTSEYGAYISIYASGQWK